MPQFFFNKRLIVLLVSIIVLVALIGFSLRDRAQLTWTEQFLKDSSGFVQTIVGFPLRLIDDGVENVKNLLDTYEENTLLRSRLDQYGQLDSEATQLRKENEELRALLDKTESLRDYESIQATVIGRNPDRWDELITINKGSVHGVEKDMAVITAKGLVGKVKSTAQTTSTVQLISSSDPTNRISAIVQSEETQNGVIEGYDRKEEKLILRRIPYDAEIEEGQRVVSSGLGGVFPSGLQIGTISSIEPDEYGLTKMAYIEPEADLYQLENVVVANRVIEGTEAEFESAEEEDGA
ncbi:rod shape-determining protein MreC [Bacillus fonticola]|uniref:rod shape-determining protein MreC n=1 Tax=Bacillus fonticola TaxID=2728853 RepID=UPI0014749800|nr:rod shape-determining protein MreC [Bacillus fonticola]